MSIIDAVPGLIVKTARAESPFGLPTAVTLYEPAGSSATTKEPPSTPLRIEHAGELTGSPDNEQLVSFVEKSEPETFIVEPNWPELESKDMDGPRLSLRFVVSLEFANVDVVIEDELVNEVELATIMRLLLELLRVVEETELIVMFDVALEPVRVDVALKVVELADVWLRMAASDEFVLNEAFTN